MPLHTYNKVRGGVELYGFDDAIQRRDGSDEQVVARGPNGLVAGVHLRQGPFGEWNQPGKSRSRSDSGWVGIHDRATGAMIHLGLYVLNQGAVAPDIEGLGAVADGEDGLLEVEGVLKQDFIDSGTSWVGWAALRNWIFAKSSWVDIETTAGQQDALNAAKESDYAILALVQRNNDWGHAHGVEGGKIGRQRTLVVFCVAAGWFRDGYVERHGFPSVMTKHPFAIEDFSLR
jgi:hypothetical protein